MSDTTVPPPVMLTPAVPGAWYHSYTVTSADGIDTYEGLAIDSSTFRHSVPTGTPAWQAMQMPDPGGAAKVAYAAAIAAGVTIHSTSTPGINGTYSIGDSSLLMIDGENSYISNTSEFSNGQASRMWLDAAGTPHLFPSIAVWKSWAEAVAQYIDALEDALATALAGGSWIAPSNAIIIA